MPYQSALAHRLGFEPGSPDYETTALPTELSRLASSSIHHHHHIISFSLSVLSLLLILHKSVFISTLCYIILILCRWTGWRWRRTGFIGTLKTLGNAMTIWVQYTPTKVSTATVKTSNSTSATTKIRLVKKILNFHVQDQRLREIVERVPFY